MWWECQNTVTRRWFECVDQAIPWNDERLVRMEVARDISERQEMQHFRERYMGTVSHDLRGPLNFIQLAAKHLEDRLQRTDMHLGGDLVSRMERNAERMSVMIQDLSDSARLETGEPTLEREALDLGAIVADMTFGVGRTGDQDRFVVDVPRGPVPVVGDRARIERILLNLIGNALKYCENDAPVRLSVSIDEGKACVRVEDSGVGIDPDDLPHVFERFFRAERHHESGGIGLGRYITRLLVRAHGGDIRVESDPGVGTMFEFTLPLAPAEVPLVVRARQSEARAWQMRNNRITG